MTTEPKIGSYLDEEERELAELIESDAYEPGESQLTPERLAHLQEAARNTLNDDRQKISLRISKTNLARIKAKAMRAGMPYQTYINALIHKDVS